MKTLPWLAPAFCAVLLSACGSDQAPGAEASAADLGAYYGACDVEDGDHIDFAPVDGFMEETSDWVQVVSVVEATKEDAADGTRTFPATVKDPDGKRHTFKIHDSFWPGIDWGLANDAEVWVALAGVGQDPDAMVNANYVVVVEPGGDVFFPGECNEVSMRQPLARTYGNEYSAVVAATLGRHGDAIAAILERNLED